MTRSARAAALRSTALATSLALAVGIVGLAVEAAAKPRFHCRSRGRSRATSCQTARYRCQNTAPVRPPPNTARPLPPPRAARAGAGDPPACGLPPPPRKPRCRPRSPRHRRPRRADNEALENVIELVRKRKPADATQAQAAISDPVARKLAEWIILRSDNNGASVERYRAFIVGQSELALADLPAPPPRGGAVGRPSRRRHGLGMVRKRIAAVGQGQVLAGARHDRARRPGQCRTPGAQAWRNDSMSEDTESAALDLFGALITPGDHKARMDFLLYGSEHEAGACAPPSGSAAISGAGEGAHRGQQEGHQRQGPAERGAARTAWRPRLHLQQDSAAAPRREIRRGRPADDERAEGSRPAAQSDEWWIERRLLSRKCSTPANTATPI